MAYEKKMWGNKGTSGAIPISAANLNRMEDGIEEAINRVSIGVFTVNGNTTVNLGYKPRYITAISNSGTDAFSAFQNTTSDYCTITDDGFVVLSEYDITNNISSYFDVTNNEYYFAYNSTNNQFESNNNKKNLHDTTAKTSLKAKKTMEIQFTYGYETESADKFYISLLDSKGSRIYYLIDGVSGTDTEQIYNLKIEAGQSIVFEYKKDRSVDTGSDQCYFKNVKVIGAEKGNWSYMVIK